MRYTGSTCSGSNTTTSEGGDKILLDMCESKPGFRGQPLLGKFLMSWLFPRSTLQRSKTCLPPQW